ncbi:MAG: hypothetical protein CBE47_01730 [Pelagibacteraceae bacterium TMED287]|nr:MAG: hypothetical protein CBE47_01730 [Pelagibacteraceae bacterium TMED287]|tara:strand:- start:113 stop:397 length:285 start_codon:yes stop_codon:yes gene_type:complete
MAFKDNLVKQKDGSYVLKSKTKKAKKKGVCIECGENASVRDLLFEYNASDVIMVRNYIEDHLVKYPNHQKIKPDWCGTCNSLKGYKIRLNEKNN